MVLRRVQDVKEYSALMRRLEELAEAHPERIEGIAHLIEALLVLRKEHIGIASATVQLAKRRKEFEDDRKRMFADAEAALSGASPEVDEDHCAAARPIWQKTSA